METLLFSVVFAASVCFAGRGNPADITSTIESISDNCGVFRLDLILRVCSSILIFLHLLNFSRIKLPLEAAHEPFSIIATVLF
jgi:hypothetical protein